MTDTLGVDIDHDEVTAARWAGADDAVVVVELGDDGPAGSALVARDESGAVLVGSAALRSGLAGVSDPLARAAAGRPGALVALLGHVVGRATTATGASPARLAIVVPDDFAGPARDQVVAAGVSAGVADTVVVPRAVAGAQPAGVDPVAAVAAGAARVAALASTPLVTRADLGDEPDPAPPVVAPPPVGEGPVSVFEGEDGPEPTRAVPATAESTTAPPPTRPVPPVAPPTAPRAEQLRYEPPRRRVPLAAWIAAVLLGLIGAVAVALVLIRGDDSGGTITDASTTTVTTSVVPTTTEGTASTAPPTTDTTTSTTSTTSSTSTSTTTTSSSTTTVPVAVAEPGLVTLVETGLQFDDGTVLRFDQDAEVVLDEVADVLGDADDDSGYEVNEFCAGARTRVVRWGDLELVLTEDDADTEIGVFTQWYASGSDDPEGLVTRDRLGVGSTVGFLDVTYGSALVIVPAIEGEEIGLFAVTNPGSGGIVNGLTTSLDPDGTVTDLWAGDSCPRVFT